MNSEILDVGILASFFAGVIAFLSPCILPLMPGYLSVVTHLSYEDLSDTRNLPKFSRVIIPSLVFILGFSTVFISLGAFSSQLGGMISGNKTFLLRIAGIFIIIFGIFVMEIVKIPFLEREHKNLPSAGEGKSSRNLHSRPGVRLWLDTMCRTYSRIHTPLRKHSGRNAKRGWAARGLLTRDRYTVHAGRSCV